MTWKVYLSGEIHSDWRQQLLDGVSAHNLPITFTSAVTDHEASDAAGDLLGAEQDAFWRDHKSSKVNAIRTRTHLQDCDIAIIRFGDKFKQWNAAFDAGFCAAKGKPYITFHGGEAEEHAKAFTFLAKPEQDAVIAFLLNLIYIDKEEDETNTGGHSETEELISAISQM